MKSLYKSIPCVQRSAIVILTSAILTASFAFGQTKAADAFIDSGYKLMDSRDYKGAIAEFTKAIAADRKSAYAYHARGQAKSLIEDNDGAIADFSKAILLDPKTKDSYLDRGNLLHMKGRYDAAIADFTKYIARDYKGLEGYLQRGCSLYAKKDLRRALAEFTELLRMSPNHTAAWINSGLIRMDMKQYDLAVADFTSLIEIEPTNTGFKEYRSRAYRKAGKINLALDDAFVALVAPPELEEGEWSKHDEFGDLKPQDLEDRMFDLAVLLTRVHKTARVHLIAYAGRTGPKNDALLLMAPAKRHLETYGVPTTRITTVDGGFREERTLEIYIISAGGKLRTPRTPDVPQPPA